MQRQSLGSPSSKLNGNGGAAGVGERAESQAAAESSKKKGILRSTPRSVHLIPVLVTLCFLILYLSSHDPAPKDLSTIGGFAGILDPKGISGSGPVRFLEAERSGLSAFRGRPALKNRQLRAVRHRKLGPP